MFYDIMLYYCISFVKKIADNSMVILIKLVSTLSLMIVRHWADVSTVLDKDLPLCPVDV